MLLLAAFLDYRRKKVRYLLEQLANFTIKHISRAYNKRADCLSKKGLILEEGTLEVTHYHELRPPDYELVRCNFS